MYFMLKANKRKYRDLNKQRRGNLSGCGGIAMLSFGLLMLYPSPLICMLKNKVLCIFTWPLRVEVMQQWARPQFFSQTDGLRNDLSMM